MAYQTFYQGDTPTFRFEFKARDGSALPEGIAAVFVVAKKCGTEVFRGENLLDGTGKADFRIYKSVSDAMEPGEYRWGISLKYNTESASNADYQTLEGNGKLFVSANITKPGADSASNAAFSGDFIMVQFTVNPYQVTGGGTSNYADLSGKPQINDVELSGNKTGEELGLADAQSLENKANKIPVANQWKYTIESIEDVPVADGDVFQIITGDADIPILELTAATLDGTTVQWFVSPEIGSSELNLQNVTATKSDGTDSLTVSIVSEQVYKDLSDVETEVLQEINSESYSRSTADEQLRQLITNLLTAYRTANAQDIIDNLIKSQKLDKTAFIDTVVNPNGWIILWLQPIFTENSVIISYGAFRPATGQFLQDNVALPFADATQAGIVTKEQAAAIEKNSQDIQNILQTGSIPLDFDTRAALAAYDATTNAVKVGQDTTVLADEGENGAVTKWIYDPDSTRPGAVLVNGFRFRFIGQEVPYTIATAAVLGLVLSSSEDGKGLIESNGVISVKGWDAVKSAIQTLQQFVTQQNIYNSNHNHSGGANGAAISYNNLTDKPLEIILYQTITAAKSDISGNPAFAPVTEVIIP